jgi:putative acetyltransferase
MQYKTFHIRPWEPRDRAAAANLIASVLTEYGLTWQPQGADRDVLEIETAYSNGEFWVIEDPTQQIIGTAAYYPVSRGPKSVEIRKMYLAPNARGQGLGRHLLTALETAIRQKGHTEIWIETSSLLKEAVQLYETSGYIPSHGLETPRCDRIYRKILT